MSFILSGHSDGNTAAPTADKRNPGLAAKHKPSLVARKRLCLHKYTLQALGKSEEEGYLTMLANLKNRGHEDVFSEHCVWFSPA